MDKFEEAWKENRHVWESSKNLAKAMYLAGQQSQQAEVDQQKLLTRDSELHLDAAKEEIERLKGVVNERGKRIESALSELESLHNKKWAEWKEQADMHSQGEANAYEHAMQILEKVLGGEHEA